MDQEIEIPEDGTLPPITVTPNRFKSCNIMIIKVPDCMRSPSENPSPPAIQLATIDRSIPGINFDGNKTLDKLIPGLSKVTLLEDSHSKEDSPPPKEFIPVRDIKPQENHSNLGSRSRPRYRKPRLERNHKPHPDEINPWVPGNEPYISHGNRYNLPTIPLVGENTSRNTIDYNSIGNRPISDKFVPNRESHPLPIEYPNSVGLPEYPNNSSALSSEHPHNPGGFIKGPSPIYPGGYGDCLPPTYPSQHGFFGNHPNDFNNSSGNPFGRRQDQPRDVGNGYRNNNTRGGANRNQSYHGTRGKNNYHGRGYKRSWSEDRGPSSHNTDRGQNWHGNQQTKTTGWKNTNVQGRFNSRAPVSCIPVIKHSTFPKNQETFYNPRELSLQHFVKTNCYAYYYLIRDGC